MMNGIIYHIELLFLFVLLGKGIDPSHNNFGTDLNDHHLETDYWAVELRDGVNPMEIAAKHGHLLEGKIEALANVYIFRKHPETVFGKTHPHHENSSEIMWSERQVARQLHKRDSLLKINDPLYPIQWHLHQNNPFNNVFINVSAAWVQNIVGTGVVIGVVDDGLEYNHPDIEVNYRADLSYDYNFNDANAFPDGNSDDHGTSAGGVAAAHDNSVCGVGVAPRAGLAGIRLISKPSTDAEEGRALSHKINDVHIYTNSWGPIDDGRRKEGPGRLALRAITTAIKEGRNGKGSIFIWAGGNGRRSSDNCNYDGWANSRFTIAIGATDYLGTQSWYSESCSMLVVSAPSSGAGKFITTTDLRGSRGTANGDCTSTFGGTSAAAPLAAGVVALILQANPNLGWRDVQGVLIHSASMTDPADSDWKVNGAGLKVNHKYGYGLINAGKAVELAKNWTNLGEQKMIEKSLTGLSIPISETSTTTSTLTVEENLTVEQVEVWFKSRHPRRGDLRIVLVSPHGTESVLAELHGDTKSNYDWIFGSMRHWGESSAGEWTLQVRDEKESAVGEINEWTLLLYGH